MKDVDVCSYFYVMSEAEHQQRAGHFEIAKKMALAGIKLAPHLPMAHNFIAQIYLKTGEWKKAPAHFKKSYLWERGPQSAHRVSEFVMFPKLKHDLEQLDYLIKIGVLPRKYSNKLVGLRKLIHAAVKENNLDGGVYTKDVKSLINSFYNKAVHTYSPGPIRGGALNPKLRCREIEKSYFARNKLVTYIDDFLTPKALNELRRFCMESTFWFDTKYHGYIGAYMTDGFSCGLVFQIAEELKTKFPRIFGDRVLKQSWAYKYDQKLSGINAHADDARVNCNFWITPNSANLDPSSGGLVVWHCKPPASWSFDDYNSYQNLNKINHFVRRSKTSMLRIPYRQNRMVLFDSMYFHKTDTLSFAEGYENRRINVTLLYEDKPGTIV